MGNQRGTQPGVMLYFLPIGPGRSKSVSGLPPSGLPPKNPGGWGGPNDTFWCCYGTGILFLNTCDCESYSVCCCCCLNLLVTARLAAEKVWRGEGEPWLGRTAAWRRRAAAEGLGARLTQRWRWTVTPEGPGENESQSQANPPSSHGLEPYRPDYNP